MTRRAIDLAVKLGWAPVLMDRAQGPTWRFQVPLPGHYVQMVERPDADLTVLDIAQIALRHKSPPGFGSKLEEAIHLWADGVLGADTGAPPPRASVKSGGRSYMALDTPIGSRIRFMNSGGYPSELEAARKKLDMQSEYEVLEISVGGFSSRVRISEGWFNTVLFENVAEPEPSGSPACS